MFEQRQNSLDVPRVLSGERRFHTLDPHLTNQSSFQRELIVLTVKGLPQRCEALLVPCTSKHQVLRKFKKQINTFQAAKLMQIYYYCDMCGVNEVKRL